MADEDKAKWLSPYDFKRLLEAGLSHMTAAYESGTATGGSQTTLEDTSKNWSTNIWRGCLLNVTIDDIEYVRPITSNTDDTITFGALPVGISVASGNKYTITRALTPWATEGPEEIFSQDIVTADTFYSTMVDWTKGKRLVIKIESSLDQAIILQPIGNITDTVVRAVDINGPIPCVINGNISIGFAWDDWHPYIGIEITTAIAPTAGTLTIWAVIQE